MTRLAVAPFYGECECWICFPCAGEISSETPMETAAQFFLRIKRLRWICTDLATVFADTCHEAVVD
jgi:hypothetical protein